VPVAAFGVPSRAAPMVPVAELAVLADLESPPHALTATSNAAVIISLPRLERRIGIDNSVSSCWSG
jgi:hypothetical protein